MQIGKRHWNPNLILVLETVTVAFEKESIPIAKLDFEVWPFTHLVKIDV